MGTTKGSKPGGKGGKGGKGGCKTQYSNPMAQKACKLGSRNKAGCKNNHPAKKIACAVKPKKVPEKASCKAGHDKITQRFLCSIVPGKVKAGTGKWILFGIAALIGLFVIGWIWALVRGAGFVAKNPELLA